MTLSPKAKRFIEIAMQGVDNLHERAVWDARDHDVGGPLPDAVARAALTALQQFERRLRTQLEISTDEDERSDLSNDLGFVFSIEGDLIKQLGGRAAAAGAGARGIGGTAPAATSAASAPHAHERAS